MPESYYSVLWKDGAVHLLDQKALPQHERWIVCTDVAQVAQAIVDMHVRGAPPSVWPRPLEWPWPRCRLAAMTPASCCPSSRRPAACSGDTPYRGEPGLGGRPHAGPCRALQSAARRMRWPPWCAKRGHFPGERGRRPAALRARPGSSTHKATILTHCNAGPRHRRLRHRPGIIRARSSKGKSSTFCGRNAAFPAGCPVDGLELQHWGSLSP